MRVKDELKIMSVQGISISTDLVNPLFTLNNLVGSPIYKMTLVITGRCTYSHDKRDLNKKMVTKTTTKKELYYLPRKVLKLIK